jgi:hypothetical protein
VLRLLVTANVVPSLLILSTLKIEEVRCSETSVLTGATRRHISEHGILQICFYYSFTGYNLCSEDGVSRLFRNVGNLLPGQERGNPDKSKLLTVMKAPCSRMDADVGAVMGNRYAKDVP